MDLSMQQVKIHKDSSINGLVIKEANIPREIKIIGLKRQDGEMIVKPTANETLNTNCILIVLGENIYINKLSEMAKSRT